MKGFGLLLAMVLLFSGCSLLSKIAPPQYDESGQAVPGTHDVIQPVKSVVGNIPYANPVLGILLLCWNFAETFRANKTQKGLMATVRAIEQAANDPEIKEAVAKIKGYLSNAHDIAEVQSLIKSALSKA